MLVVKGGRASPNHSGRLVHEIATTRKAKRVSNRWREGLASWAANVPNQARSLAGDSDNISNLRCIVSAIALYVLATCRQGGCARSVSQHGGM